MGKQKHNVQKPIHNCRLKTLISPVWFSRQIAKMRHKKGEKLDRKRPDRKLDHLTGRLSSFSKTTAHLKNSPSLYALGKLSPFVLTHSPCKQMTFSLLRHSFLICILKTIAKGVFMPSPFLDIIVYLCDLEVY